MPGARGRGGFTLIEALFAVTIGSLVVLLASTLFLLQNDHYNYVLERSRTQDNARSVAELVAEDVRSIPAGAVIEADSTELVFRRPLAVGVICDVVGSVHVLHVPGGTAGFETDDVSGFGLRADDGTWSFTDAPWVALYGGTTLAASFCAGEGADTVGAYSEFLLFGDLATLSGSPTEIGDAVMLFQELQLEFAPSTMNPDTRALYRGPAGGTLVEFATGLSADAHFSYRTGDTTHATSVSSVGEIDGVRVHALTESAIGSARREDVTFEFVSDVLLRNGG